MTPEERIQKALIIAKYGANDGAHHKMWVIDQMLRVLLGNKYGEWVRDFEDGEDGPDTYWWDEGIAP